MNATLYKLIEGMHSMQVERNPDYPPTLQGTALLCARSEVLVHI